jgi:hypothetical protein
LPLITSVQQRGRARALANGAQATISSIDAYLLAESNLAGERSALTALLDDIEATMTRVAEAVGDAYLQHLPRYRA